MSGKSKNDQDGRTLLDLVRSRDKLLKKKSDGTSSSHAATRTSPDGAEGISIDEQIALTEETILNHLSALNTSIQHRGLFGSEERARDFYSLASDRSSAVAANIGTDGGGSGATATGGGGGKKRKRKGGDGNSSNSSSGGLSAASYGIHLESHSNAFSGVSTGGGGNNLGDSKGNLNEGLIVTALCRILGVTVGRRKKANHADCADDMNGESKDGTSTATNIATNNRSSSQLMMAALTVLTSLCAHAKDGAVPALSSTTSSSTTGASIEADMIGSIGSHLLDALSDTILYCHYSSRSSSASDTNLSETKDGGLVAALKMAASVVLLLEVRLARSDKTMQSLREAAWLVINNNSSICEGGEEDGVPKAAAVLLASFPLAGNSDSVPQSKLWSQAVRDGAMLLRWTICDFFPMPSLGDGGGKKGESDGGDGMLKSEARANPSLWKDHENWVSIVTENTSDDSDLEATDDQRSKAFLSRIQFLNIYISSLLKMEGYPLHKANDISSSVVLLPLGGLLDTSEVLLSFPLAAEAKHRTTKSRLRSSPVDGGRISPNAAMNIAVGMRLCGHSLFDVALESCRGGSGAVGRARRIVGMTVANLQSSCSLPLVSVVVDGSRQGGGGSSSSRMGSWLRGSIPLRIKSIQTFRTVAISLGSGVMSSTGTAKSVCRALILLGGCLLEQARGGEESSTNGSVEGDEWGTIGERANLM